MMLHNMWLKWEGVRLWVTPGRKVKGMVHNRGGLEWSENLQICVTSSTNGLLLFFSSFDFEMHVAILWNLQWRKKFVFISNFLQKKVL